MERSWSDYYRASSEKPLHPIFEVLRPLLPPSGVALDLGCGTGRASRFLLDLGFDVVAVDREEEAVAALADTPAQRVLVDLAEFEPPPCDVVIAQFALFFLPKRDFDGLWSRIRTALRPRGLFCGQLLGPNDDWGRDGCTTHDRAQVDHLFAGFEFHHRDEVDRDGETVLKKPKHWHVHHIVARKHRGERLVPEAVDPTVQTPDD